MENNAQGCEQGWGHNEEEQNCQIGKVWKAGYRCETQELCDRMSHNLQPNISVLRYLYFEYCGPQYLQASPTQPTKSSELRVVQEVHDAGMFWIVQGNTNFTIWNLGVLC